MKKLTAVFIFSAIFASAVFAQKNYLEPADRTYNAKNYFDAVILYKKAYSKEKNKATKASILFKIGECHRLTSDPVNAEGWYSKAIKANYSDPLVYLYYAQTLQANGNYPEAIVNYNRFKQEVPSDPRGEEGAKACEMAQKWKDSAKKNRFRVNNMAELNSKFSDLAATYSSNTKKGYNSIIFSSSREEATGKDFDASWSGEKNTDLFETMLDKKGKWSTPVSIPEPFSTDEKEGPATVNRKASTMYFTKCGEQKKIVACKIYSSTKKGTSGWEAPEILPLCANDSFAYGHPSLSADEMSLYFSSNRDGGQGGYDIWVSKYDKKSKQWGEPVNVGAPINTQYDEMFPFIHANGTLYFSSTGHYGEGNMGGTDIFSTSFKDGKWGNIKNMQAPINSAADDYAIVWEDETDKGFLTSNREGGKGKDDIYSFELKPLLFTLQGQVFDVDSKVILPGAKVELFCTTDGTSISAIADKTASYKFTLALNKNYTAKATKERYLGAQGDESTMGLEESKDFIRDFYLKTTEKEIVLPNILYGLDSFNLRPESKTALDGLIKTLNENPQIVIELRSHTDTRADDNYNIKLSQARAQSVVDYLIANGIAKDRLVARGYGEKVPRVLQQDETVYYYNNKFNDKGYTFTSGSKITDDFIAKFENNDEKEAAHQLNRRTEFKVLRDDYVPTNAPKGVIQTPKDTTTAMSVSREAEPKPEEESTSEKAADSTGQTTGSNADTTSAKKEKYYVTEKGDSYASICEKFNIKEDDLRRINETKGNKPKVGTKLKVVDDYIYHEVVKGDTYAKLAKQYGIKTDQLKKVNKIKDELIKEFIGKKLIVGTKD